MNADKTFCDTDLRGIDTDSYCGNHEGHQEHEEIINNQLSVINVTGLTGTVAHSASMVCDLIGDCPRYFDRQPSITSGCWVPPIILVVSFGRECLYHLCSAGRTIKESFWRSENAET